MTRTHMYLAVVLTAMLMTTGCPATLEGNPTFQMDDDDDDDATGDDDTTGDDDSGDDDSGDDDTGDDDTEVSVISLSSNYMSTCAIQTDNTVRCWGMDVYALGGEYQQVEFYTDTICGLHLDGTIECNGQNEYGQAEPPAGEFIDMDIRATFGCAVRASDGGLECWGRTENFEDVIPQGSFVDVAVTLDKVCAMDTNGELTCWGFYGGTEYAPTGQMGQLVSSINHFCALTSTDGMVCWGAEYPANTSGILGFWFGPYESVTVSGSLSCGLTPSGGTACHGWDEHPGLTQQPPEPLDELVVGGAHLCGVAESDGEVVCWGDNTFNQCDVPNLI